MTLSMSGASASPTALTGRPCPICGKPGVVAMRPFCSKRCADVDLNRWLSGVYAVPAVESDEDGLEDESGSETLQSEPRNP
jgi:endogenous inhibitor of DNA gyrase (YacG/DUF329 family)